MNEFTHMIATFTTYEIGTTADLAVVPIALTILWGRHLMSWIGFYKDGKDYFAWRPLRIDPIRRSRLEFIYPVFPFLIHGFIYKDG